jgi:UDP-N-acetyl-D-galactosamine dehydrogenase
MSACRWPSRSRSEFETTGLDIDTRRIEELKSGHDRTVEIERERMEASSLAMTADPAACPPSDFYIETVPTPIHADNRPDLGAVEKASRTVSALLPAAIAEGRVPVVVYESTVYPGVTKDLCASILEEVSGLVCGTDFFLGYSPERINLGDREHTIDKITKVVSGQPPKMGRCR